MRDGDAVEDSIIWTAASHSYGSDTGRSIVSVRFLITDLFLESYSGTVCAGYFFRSQDGSGIGNDYISETYRTFFVRGACAGGIYRIFVIDRIYLIDVAKDPAYGITFGRWYHDRIYLLGDY
mgnify:CR=1 FL=1